MSQELYVSAVRPQRANIAYDEWYSEPRETVDVIVEECAPINTGLVDQYGVSIYRVPRREKCGF